MVKQRILLLPSLLSGLIPQAVVQAEVFLPGNKYRCNVYILLFWGRPTIRVQWKNSKTGVTAEDMTWFGTSTGISSGRGVSGWEHVLSLCCSVLCVSKGNYLELSGSSGGDRVWTKPKEVWTRIKSEKGRRRKNNKAQAWTRNVWTSDWLRDKWGLSLQTPNVINNCALVCSFLNTFARNVRKLFCIYLPSIPIFASVATWI